LATCLKKTYAVSVFPLVAANTKQMLYSIPKTHPVKAAEATNPID
jgi:hypothetical protein